MENNTREAHCNKKQLMFQICMSYINYIIWGRSTGKTEGPVCDFLVENVFAMPRSNGFFMGTSYSQILTRTIPGVISALSERYGLEENKHFWLRKYAPESLGIKKAFKHPVDPSSYWQWHNGTGLYLVSQDRPGSINGVRTQWGIVDEAKYINKKRFDDEVIPTMSGLYDQYGDKWNYLSLLFCSDMPRSTKGRWLLEGAKMMDEATISSIVEVHSSMQLLVEQFENASPSAKKRIRPKIIKLHQLLNELRKDTVYSSRANILDNLDALGLEPLKHFRRVLDDIDFDISIMNRPLFKDEKGFYALLDDEQHGYSQPNEEFMDQLDIDFRNPPPLDCRWEKDTNAMEPLNTSCDHNNAINCVVTTQLINKDFKLLSALWVEHPELIKDCARKWHEFYKYHQPYNKVVNHIYDATSKAGRADTDINFSDIWVKELTDLGWEVYRHDIGQIGSHHSRFHFWNLLLSGRSEQLPRFWYNKNHAADWYIAAQQTGILSQGDKVKKDKSSEKPNSGIPPHEATHLTEALDINIWGLLRPLINESSEFFEAFSA